jgi:PilZ domain
LAPEVDLFEGFKNRKRTRSRVDIEGAYNYSSKWYPCVLRDLTTEGAGLKINQIFVPGDIIRLKFGVGTDDRIVEATVANVSGNRIGVKFSVDLATREFVKTVIQESD